MSRKNWRNTVWGAAAFFRLMRELKFKYDASIPDDILNCSVYDMQYGGYKFVCQRIYFYRNRKDPLVRWSPAALRNAILSDTLDEYYEQQSALALEEQNDSISI